MSVTIECPQCGKRHTVDESASGQTAVCEACGTRMQIPDLGPAASAEETPAPGALGETCPVCGRAIEADETAVACEVCGQVHHQACWEAHKGCGRAQCDNAPLPDLGFAPGDLEPPPAPAPGPGPAPGALPGGAGPPPSATSGFATASLVCGILSLVSLPTCFAVPCCGSASLLLAIAAVITGVVARREIARSDGRIAGDGLALAGLIIGIATIALDLLLFFARILLFGLAFGA